MNVTWHRMATPQLSQPQICAASGAQATSLLPTVFRNRTSYYLPGIGRFIMTMTNRPVVMGVPVCDQVRQRVTTWRLLSVFAPLGGVVLGLILAVAIGDTFGGLVFFVFLAASIAFAIFGRLHSDVFGTDVSGDQIIMSNAHPAYADALLRSNPAGMVQLNGARVPVNRPYPQQPYPQAQPNYPQPNYPQPNYPRQNYPQQLNYPHPGYPKPQQPSGYDPVLGYRSPDGPR